jgi:hypothetical protein
MTDLAFVVGIGVGAVVAFILVILVFIIFGPRD